jgi:hypothetical protein
LQRIAHLPTQVWSAAGRAMVLDFASLSVFIMIVLSVHVSLFIINQGRKTDGTERI